MTSASSNAIKLALTEQDIETAIHKLKDGYTLFEELDKRVKQKREVVKTALSIHGNSLIHAHKKFTDDEDLVALALRTSPLALKYASERLRDNESIVLTALAGDPEALEYASDRLSDDVGFIQQVLREGIKPEIRFCGDTVKNNIPLAKQVIKDYPREFLNFKDDVRDNSDIVEQLLGLDPEIFNAVSPRIRGIKDIAIEAVRKYPWNLQYLSKELQADRDVVSLVANNAVMALTMASPELGRDVKLIFSSFDKSPYEVRYYVSQSLPKELKTEVALDIKQFLSYQSKEWFQKAFNAVNKNGENLTGDINVDLEAQWILNHCPEDILNTPVENGFLKEYISAERDRRRIYAVSLNNNLTTENAKKRSRRIGMKP